MMGLCLMGLLLFVLVGCSSDGADMAPSSQSNPPSQPAPVQPAPAQNPPVSAPAVTVEPEGTVTVGTQVTIRTRDATAYFGFTQRPHGSQSLVSAQQISEAMFTPDLPGTY